MSKSYVEAVEAVEAVETVDSIEDEIDGEKVCDVVLVRDISSDEYPDDYSDEPSNYGSFVQQQKFRDFSIHIQGSATAHSWGVFMDEMMKNHEETLDFIKSEFERYGISGPHGPHKHLIDDFTKKFCTFDDKEEEEGEEIGTKKDAKIIRELIGVLTLVYQSLANLITYKDDDGEIHCVQYPFYFGNPNTFRKKKIQNCLIRPFHILEFFCNQHGDMLGHMSQNWNKTRTVISEEFNHDGRISKKKLEEHMNYNDM